MSEKRRWRHKRVLALLSPWARLGDKGFILRRDYCFLTTQWRAFNPMHHTGWIVLLILSFPTCGTGSEGAATWESSSITLLHQSRDFESEIVEKYSPQGACDIHPKYSICYSLVRHCYDLVPLFTSLLGIAQNKLCSWTESDFQKYCLKWCIFHM